MRVGARKLAAVTLIGGLFFSWTPVSAQSDACGYRQPAHHVRELVALQKGPGLEIYVLFADSKNQMVSTFGTMRLWINDIEQTRWIDIDCRDFRFFERGIHKEVVLGYVFDWIPFNKVQARVIYYDARPAPRNSDNYAKLRLATTYSLPIEATTTFLARRNP